MFSPEVCHSAAFVSPPSSPPANRPSAGPSLERLSEMVRANVLAKWDSMSPAQRVNSLRDFGAALLVLSGSTQAKIAKTSRVNRTRVQRIVATVRGS